MKMNLLKRFNIYQKERFQISILVFTTISVVLSSAAVVLGPGDVLSNHILGIFIALITSLLFMFHIRVLDEHKDYDFDTKYHMNRPVQRGLISLKELLTLNIIGLIILFSINVIVSTKATIFLLFAFGYTLIAGKEFFIKNWIRKRFFLYNLVNLLQLLFLQFYLYSIIEPNFSFGNPILSIHFVFVLFNVGLLEFARKLKTKAEENEAQDTYSSKIGIRKASMIYAAICLIVFGLFTHMFFEINNNVLLFIIGLGTLNIAIFSIIYYASEKHKNGSMILQIFAALYYIAMHLLLVISKL
ncbi:hypothetical protein CL617_01040 [archaeon]|nr:hypothetical protein [archaeon]|tara:strand:- start:9199 stop:10098 length:900 start_codon:yes stop_codon:yes gene_type:complete